MIEPESVGKVISYLAKHSPVMPSPESGKMNLDGKKQRVKGSKLDEWRIRGTEGGVCGECNQKVGRLTVDHIIPLTILASLDDALDKAINDETNFQLLCELCNRKKSGYLDIRNPKTAPLLAKYIAPYLHD